MKHRWKRNFLESRIFKKTSVGGENAPAFQKREVMDEMKCKRTIAQMAIACGGRGGKRKPNHPPLIAGRRCG